METILFLVAFPLVIALILLVLPWNGFRKVVVWIASAVLCAASIYLLVQNIGQKNAVFFPFENEWISKGMFVIEGLISLYILVVSIMKKKWLAAFFVILQYGMITYFEVVFGATAIAEKNLFVDQFSIIMALIIGIIGSLICVYAVGYMKDFHHHHSEMKDKRPIFFFILFVFLSAMFGIVFSNNLMWLLFFWEITTLCSFLLIGYTKTEEAQNNAFLAITINLAGGLAFAGAIIYLFQTTGIIELDKLLAQKNAVVLIPVALICFAGLTKAAQMPFSKWLLGAMVAPTPTSALLHSSTMVKAGVYIILRMSPLIMGTAVGYTVAIIGAVTFLLASFIAISQRNAKKVLAYSTIANLGLIVACAGVGTYQTIWAGIFLIIFHAVAKSLLFLTVGTVEHRLGSRDIEHMDNLIVKMPTIALLMVVGICGMFIAPFGMLISKWAAMEAFVNVNPFISPILILLLVYGSAVTVFFWTKWLGKLIAIRKINKTESLEKQISSFEWVAEWVHAILTIGICLLFPFVSYALVDPYIQSIYGQGATMANGNFLLMAIMVGMLIVIPAVKLLLQNEKRNVTGTPYMAGRNTTEDLHFEGTMGIQQDLTLKNYYLENIFGENKLLKAGIFITAILSAIMIGVAFL